MTAKTSVTEKSGVPSQNRNIRIGTSGYSYDDRCGAFYPDSMQKKDMLEYYTRHFSTVEINATYYAIPSASVFSRMAQKRPPDVIAY